MIPWYQVHNTQQKYFKEKLDVFDFLWLLERMKEITSGMCVKLNNCYNTHKATLKFLAMNQWKQESDDSFIKRFNTSIHTLDISGGKHILCIKESMDK